MIMSFSSISCAFSKTFSCPTEISPNFNVLYKQLTLNMLQCLILLSFHFFLSAVQPFGPFGSAGRPVLPGAAHRFGLPLASNSRAIGAVCHAFPPCCGAALAGCGFLLRYFAKTDCYVFLFSLAVSGRFADVFLAVLLTFFGLFSDVFLAVLETVPAVLL